MNKKQASFSTIAAAICLLKAVQLIFFTDKAIELNFGADGAGSTEAAQAQTRWFAMCVGVFYFGLSGWHCEPGYDKAKALFWTFCSLFSIYYTAIRPADMPAGMNPALLQANTAMAFLLAVGFWSRAQDSLSLENVTSSTFFLNFVLFTFYTRFALSLYFPGVEISGPVIVLTKSLGIANFCQAGFVCRPGYDKAKAILFTAYAVFFGHYAFAAPAAREGLGIDFNMLAPWVVIMSFWARCYWQRAGGFSTNSLAQWMHLANFLLFTFCPCAACKMYFPSAQIGGDAAKAQLKWLFLGHGMFNFAMAGVAAAPGYDRVKFFAYSSASVLFGNYVFRDSGARLATMGANPHLVTFWTAVTAGFAYHYFHQMKGGNVQSTAIFAIVLGAIANQA
jgi:hypothetical protein